LRSKRQSTEEKGLEVPAYIVTFSDMVTLLLTFFVMLLSLSSVQDPEMFNMGRGAFVQTIRNLGLGVLYGRKSRPNFGHVKTRYFISRPDTTFEGRSVDAKREETRRIFQKVNWSMTAMPSQIVAKRTDFSVTNIRFAPGDARLNESAKKFLTEFCLDLQQDSDSEALRVYVLGLADDQPTERKQWILSAQRAKEVADFLKDTMPSRLSWPVYWWGAGPGGNWVGTESPVSEQSQMLIAVLRATN
jgi:chemotaxis protein MotB